MKIIGGHDYYDQVMAYGQDNEVIFLRHKEKEIDAYIRCDCEELSIYGFQNAKEERIRFDTWQNRLGNFSFQEYRFIVAGKAHQLLRLELTKPSQPLQIFHCWTYEQLDNTLALEGISRILKAPRTRYPRARSQTGSSWFDPYLYPETMNWLITNKYTILRTHYINNYKKVYRVDPFDLGKFEMQKKLDPYTIFQEISMWVGSVLPRNPNQMVEIKDDKIKLSKHGMDKWSFRKMKENK